MSISIPRSLKEFVDAQTVECGFSTNDEYVRALIQREQDRSSLRETLMGGANSGIGVAAESTYFNALRVRIRRRK